MVLVVVVGQVRLLRVINVQLVLTLIDHDPLVLMVVTVIAVIVIVVREEIEVIEVTAIDEQALTSRPHHLLKIGARQAPTRTDGTLEIVLSALTRGMEMDRLRKRANQGVLWQHPGHSLPASPATRVLP